MRFYSLQALGVEKSDDPEFQIEREEIKDIMDRELAALPARERDAIIGLAGLYGSSCRSVARQYAVAPQTASNWAAAAGKKLRPRLEGLL